MKVTGFTGAISDIYFINDSIGFLSLSSSPSFILRTSNMGESWVMVISSTDSHIG